MCNPIPYVTDCMRIVETVMNHRPRPPYSNEEMHSVQNSMQLLWKAEFKEDIEADDTARDFTSVLPAPIVLEIFKYFDYRDLLGVIPVSKHFQRVSNSDEVSLNVFVTWSCGKDYLKNANKRVSFQNVGFQLVSLIGEFNMLPA